jgi:hypothetical protein
MSQTFSKTYFIKKGAADPFRGDWYIEEKTLSDLSEAISAAADLTLKNFNEFGKDWDEFGYEWSVFEKEEMKEIKLWEGFKYISFVRKGRTDLNLGRV